MGGRYEIRYEENNYVFTTYTNSFWKFICSNCEKKFREWLKEKELVTTEEMIARFPIYKGE